MEIRGVEPSQVFRMLSYVRVLGTCENMSYIQSPHFEPHRHAEIHLLCCQQYNEPGDAWRLHWRPFFVKAAHCVPANATETVTITAMANIAVNAAINFVFMLLCFFERGFQLLAGRNASSSATILSGHGTARITISALLVAAV